MPGLSRLSVSPEGLAFDPSTGDSYTVNRTGLLILRTLQDGGGPEDAVRLLTEKYQVSAADAQGDVADFQGRLRSLGLL
jgi:PqqD family protein of HPr-rel-A system